MNAPIDLWIFDANRQPWLHETSWMDRLSLEEQVRAARFVVEPARRQFVLARGLLRSMLAHRLNARPEQLPIELDDLGKPKLGGKWRGALEFNISHSDSVVAIALAEVPVGVDIEQIDPAVSIDAISMQYFYPSEHRYLQGLNQAEKLRHFYGIWTAKEALLKLLGLGWRHEPSVPRVPLPLDAKAAIRLLPESTLNTANLRHFDELYPDFALAVAVLSETHEPEYRVHFFEPLDT